MLLHEFRHLIEELPPPGMIEREGLFTRLRHKERNDIPLGSARFFHSKTLAIKQTIVSVTMNRRRVLVLFAHWGQRAAGGTFFRGNPLPLVERPLFLCVLALRLCSKTCAKGAVTGAQSASRKSQQPASLVGKESHHPGQHAHVSPLKRGPPPAIGLAPNDGHGADALQREDIEHHQRDPEQRTV